MEQKDSLSPRGTMIFILDETDGAQRSNELILVNANGLGLQLCHCYRARIPGSEKPYFWEGSVEMVLGLYQGSSRIPVFLVSASKEFTAGSRRAGSPHRKDFVDIQSLDDSELLCEGQHVYLAVSTAPHPLRLQSGKSFKDSHDCVHLPRDY